MLLPKNEKVKYEDNKQLSVWVMGDPGSGKTTFASKWPNPLMINTDGNYKQFEVPAVFVKEIMEVNGQVMYGFEYVEKVIDELIAQKGQVGGYETIVIDLLEDVIKLCEKMVAKQNGKEFIQDIPWGKGNKIVMDKMKTLITKLNSINMNVVYLSHQVPIGSKDINGNDIIQFVPKEMKNEMISMIAGRVKLMAALETYEMPEVNDLGNAIIDANGKPLKKMVKLLNWEKSDRLPSVVQRFNSETKYCFATYDDLMEVIM